MILLRNTDFGKEYFELNSGEFIIQDYDSEISGWYKLIKGVISGLVVINSNLYMLWGSNKYLITDFSYVKTQEIKNASSFKKLEFYDSGNLEFSYEYNVDEDYSKISPFEYLDSENYDWGSFLSNIINSRARKTVFIDNLS